MEVKDIFTIEFCDPYEKTMLAKLMQVALIKLHQTQPEIMRNSGMHRKLGFLGAELRKAQEMAESIILYAGLEVPVPDNQPIPISKSLVPAKKIQCWYGPGGSLLTNDPVPGVTNYGEMDVDAQRYYGCRYLICESLGISSAKVIAEALGLEFRWSI